jgi:hypothetical protein
MGSQGSRARTHLSTSSLGIHRSPSTFLKNFGAGADCPAASLCLTSPLCLSSTAVFAAVAPCMSADLMASVNLDHNLRASVSNDHEIEIEARRHGDMSTASGLDL